MGILTAPFRGLLRVFEEVADQAEHELHDEDAVKAELMQLYRKLEAGAVTEVDFGRREAELAQRLEVIAEWQRRRGGRAGR